MTKPSDKKKKKRSSKEKKEESKQDLSQQQTSETLASQDDDAMSQTSQQEDESVATESEPVEQPIMVSIFAMLTTLDRYKLSISLIRHAKSLLNQWYCIDSLSN